MGLEYVPLIPIMRQFYGLPRDMGRFQKYLRMIDPRDESGDQLLPLIAMNPMGKDHLVPILDSLLSMDADSVAAEATAEAAAQWPDLTEEFKVGLTLADDLMGGWTNRYANEFAYRFPHFSSPLAAEPGKRPRWLKDDWIIAVLWSSESPSLQATREAVLTAIYRAKYLKENGPARKLADMLVQEGQVMAAAGCQGPTLDEEDIAYTRIVLADYLEADDMRTCMECLFGDKPGSTLGFTPRGLSPWAGLALALHDARMTASPG